MKRILIVLRGTFDPEALRLRCASVGDAAAEIAVCLVLPTEASSLADALAAQREATRVLRDALGTAAEGVAVFVAAEQHGYRVEDCAAEWGATEVRT